MGWNEMEGKFAMKHGRFQGWKGMEDLVDVMESVLPSFHPHSIINFFTVSFFDLLLSKYTNFVLLVTSVTLPLRFLL